MPRIVKSEQLTEEQAVQQSRLLKAIADPVRLRILHILRTEEEQIHVTALVEHFNLEQPTISHHLRILRDANMIDSTKSGLHVYYHIKRETLQQALAILYDLAAA